LLHIAGPCQNKESLVVLNSILSDFADNVKYYGQVSKADKITFFESIDVLVFPTLYKNEAEPLVLLEALSSAVPCIANSMGCIIDDIGEEGGVVVHKNLQFCPETVSFIKKYLVNRAHYSNAARKRFLTIQSKYKSQINRLILIMK